IYPELTADEQRTVVGRIAEFFRTATLHRSPATVTVPSAGQPLPEPHVLARTTTAARAAESRR
ncbi:MAG: hypothetical protein ACKO6E_05250, partial [Planctomycetota bacterium]